MSKTEWFEKMKSPAQRVRNLVQLASPALMRLFTNDLVGGDQASCMLEARIANSFMNRFLRLP